MPQFFKNVCFSYVGNRRNTENGESEINGLENEHINSDINVEVEMDDISVYTAQNIEKPENKVIENNFITTENKNDMTAACSSSLDSVINRNPMNYMSYGNENNIITADTQSTEGETSLGENSGVLQHQENMTVQVNQEQPQVTEPNLNTLEESNQENEPPIYISTLNQNASIYLGTGNYTHWHNFKFWASHSHGLCGEIVTPLVTLKGS